MPRRIVFVNQATGYLTIDIINAFADHFDDVAVIYGDLRVQDVELNEKVKKSKVIEKSRKSNFRRFSRWLIASFQIFFLLITKYRKYEIFYFSVPPFAYLSSLFLKRKFSVLMWDVYPDVLKNIGISDRNLLYKSWSKINIALFKRAHRIYTIGEAPASLISQYSGGREINVIPLWRGLRNIRKTTKEENPFILENNLRGKFIVQYSGNMGQTHNVEVLIKVALKTIDNADIIYQFIGRGHKWDIIADLIKKHDLNNCIMLPFQPDNFIQYSLSSADLGVILVDNNAVNALIPSKVYNLLATGTPLLGITPNDSTVDNLIRKYDAGSNFSEEKVDEIALFIARMKSHPDDLEKYRQNAFLASHDFTPENAVKFFKQYITEQ
jgi:hypothetical protein